MYHTFFIKFKKDLSGKSCFREKKLISLTLKISNSFECIMNFLKTIYKFYMDNILMGTNVIAKIEKRQVGKRVKKKISIS